MRLVELRRKQRQSRNRSIALNNAWIMVSSAVGAFFIVGGALALAMV